MSKVSDLDGRRKPPPLCPHCAKAPESEHPFYSCPRITGVQIGEDYVGYEYAQTYAVEVTHHLPKGAEPDPE